MRHGTIALLWDAVPMTHIKDHIMEIAFGVAIALLALLLLAAEGVS